MDGVARVVPDRQRDRAAAGGQRDLRFLVGRPDLGELGTDRATSGAEERERELLTPEQLKAGTIYVNNYRATSFTSPFGGFKESGIGRESGPDAIKEYLETKTVWLSSDLDVPNPFIRR